MNGPCATSELHRQLGLSLGGGDHTFRLPGTKHAIMARQLPTRHCHISNNDHGLKPILFDIEGARDFVLDGDGAAFDCRGPVLPIRIGNSRNIIIRNLTIDWLRPSFTPATVVDAADGRLEFVCDPDEFPLAVHDDRLVACDPHDAHTGRLWNLLPFDAQRGEVSSTVENWHLGGAHTAHQVAPGRFLLEAAFPEVYAPGTPIVLMHGDRVAPGIWIEAAGAIAQLGNVGTTLGTPLLALLVAAMGPGAITVFAVPLCLGGIAMHLWLARRRRLSA